MFSKLSIIVASVLVLMIELHCKSLLPPSSPPTTPNSPQCCNSVVSSTSAAASAVAALLGLDLTGLDVSVGLSCSPITVAGNNWSLINSPPIFAPYLLPDPQPSPATRPREWGAYIAINCILVTA
ncbi:hypothetical protein K438DRAFT_1763563 [Mycena galopus ATCC 62051]|nr:hypothetical protein K438DRAFT_1763563 [Mycena galopus ATCC 62051]